MEFEILAIVLGFFYAPLRSQSGLAVDRRAGNNSGIIR